MATPERRMGMTEVVSHLDALAQSISELAGQTAELRRVLVEAEEQRCRERKADRRHYIYLVIVGLLLLVTGLTNVANTTATRKTQAQLEDCTVPSTPDDPNACYDRSRAQTGDAVADVFCAFQPELLQPEVAAFCARRASAP